MVPSSLPSLMTDWYLCIKPHCLNYALVLISAATRSLNLELRPSKIQVWMASCPDAIFQELLDKVIPTLSCLGGHLHIQGDSEPSPVVLGEQATMEKTTRRFRDSASIFAELTAEGLSAQTVCDLLTVCVGAARQHVLRMNFVPEHEARTFDTEAIAFSFVPLASQAWRTWYWLSCAAPCGCLMASLTIGSPNTRGSQSVPRHRHCLHPHAAAPRPTCAATNHTLATDEQACLLLRPLGPPTPPRRGWSPSSKSTSTNNSLTATPLSQSVEPSSSLSLHFTPVHTCCNPTAMPVRLKTLFPRVHGQEAPLATLRSPRPLKRCFGLHQQKRNR